ncbi:helix-turn-helix domain-containing protein [bacterium]|nr:helix-turn-helix domain-containing protein [bacterium]
MLTRRRKEALRALQKLTEEKDSITYEELATELGISKWSAYELLTQLENAGYVTSELRKCQGKCGGRPSLRFRLSPQGEEMLKGESYLETLREELANYFQLAKKDLGYAISTVREKLATTANPLLQSARGLTMLLLELKWRSSSLYSRIRQSLRTGDDLHLISGAALAGDKEGKLSKIVRRCQETLSRLSKVQKEIIASILREEAKEL